MFGRRTTVAMRDLLTGLDRVLNRIYTFAGAVAAGFLVLLALCVALSILTRMAGLYVAGLTAYSGYAMAASAFLALAYTFREGGHIRVALLRNRLAGRARFAVEVWCLGVASVFSVYLAWYLVRMTEISWQFGDKSEGADATPLWIPQSALAVGASVMALAAVHALIKTLLTRDIDAPFSGPSQTLSE